MNDEKESNVSLTAKRSQPWALAFCGSMFYFIIPGLARANAALFLVLVTGGYFTREEASWPFSLGGLSDIVVAPVIGLVSTFWSPQIITVWASLLFAIGHLVCYFNTNIYVLSIFLGFVRGCGQTIISVFIPAVVNTSFNHHRATAMGIVTTGMSLGGFIWPVVVQTLLEEYGLRGTFLVLTGISLHALIFCIVMMRYDQVKTKATKLEKEVDENGSFTVLRKNSYGSIITKKKDTDVQKILSFKDVFANLSEPKVARVSPKDNHQNIEEDISNNNKSVVPGTLVEDKVGSTAQVVPASVRSDTHIQALKAMFTCRCYYIITIETAICIFIMNTYVQIAMDYCVDKGIPENISVFSVMSFCCGEIIGRLCLGWITDHEFVSRPLYNAVMCSILGTAVLALIYSNSLAVVMICSCITGIALGSAMSVSFAQVSDYLSRSAVPLAFSVSRMASGVASISRAPIIGLFRDQMGSYDHLFLFMCLLCFLVALMWIVEVLWVYMCKKHVSYSVL